MSTAAFPNNPHTDERSVLGKPVPEQSGTSHGVGNRSAGDGQWITQHKKSILIRSGKGESLHEETHCVLRNKEIQTAFVNKYAKRQSGEKRTSQGRLSMLLENALDRRISTPPSRCTRRSRLRATMGYNNPNVHFILDALVGRMSCDF